MFGIFKFIFKLLIIAFCVAFVVLNRQSTIFYYSPIALPVELPLWALGIILFGIGFFSGVLLMWLNAYPQRKELKQKRKELNKIEIERDTLENSMRESAAVKLEEITGPKSDDRIF